MKNYKIVHLDNHKLITDGIGKLLGKTIPGCDYIAFNNIEDGSPYIKNSIAKFEKVDMLITDFSRSMENGYEFAKSIRQFKKKYKTSHILIVLLTMLSESTPIIRKGLKQNIFNSYLPLTILKSELSNFFKTVIYR